MSERRYLMPDPEGRSYEDDPRTILRRAIVAERDRLLLPVVEWLARTLKRIFRADGGYTTVTGPREISIPITWADNGNPVAWCSWCLETHEWTARTSDGWQCDVVADLQAVMVQDISRAVDQSKHFGLFRGDTPQ